MKKWLPWIFVGIFAAWYLYLKRPMIAMGLALMAGPVHRLLYRKYYIDELYDIIFVRPLRKLGEFCYALDRYVINGILWIVAAVPRLIGFFLKGWQTGAMQGYAMGMVVGLVVILWWVVGK